MSHTHEIIDSDDYFEINPVDRTVSSPSGKHYITQGDHNSERFTFKIPKTVEGHDLSSVDRIEIHYSNITRNKKQQNDNVYFVADEDKTVGEDPETFVFSWLVSGNATQLAGSLKFSIAFVCIDENEEVTYEWGTKTCDLVGVLDRLKNDETVQETYPDFYSQLKEEVTPVKGVDYFDGKDGESGSKGDTGEKGEKGDQGEAGFSPVVTLLKEGTVTTLEITDKNGTQKAEILDGGSGGAAELPDEEMLDCLMAIDVVQPVSDANNAVYTDENNKIYTL